MNIIKKVYLAFALSIIGFAAYAQKTLTEGVITYVVTAKGQQMDTKNYFKGDSSSYVSQQGPATLKFLTNNKSDFFVVLVDVPIASMKKAGVATPAEMEEMKDKEPSYTSTPTTETQTISGYKCKKVTVKDSKSGSNFDVWVTNDIMAPSNLLTKYFTNLGGFPIKFSTIQMGQTIDVTLKSISDEKVKPGTFSIPSDFDKISLTDLRAMSGGR